MMREDGLRAPKDVFYKSALGKEPSEKVPAHLAASRVQFNTSRNNIDSVILRYDQLVLLKLRDFG